MRKPVSFWYKVGVVLIVCVIAIAIGVALGLVMGNATIAIPIVVAPAVIIITTFLNRYSSSPPVYPGLNAEDYRKRLYDYTALPEKPDVFFYAGEKIVEFREDGLYLQVDDNGEYDLIDSDDGGVEKVLLPYAKLKMRIYQVPSLSENPLNYIIIEFENEGHGQKIVLQFTSSLLYWVKKFDVAVDNIDSIYTPKTHFKDGAELGSFSFGASCVRLSECGISQYCNSDGYSELNKYVFSPIILYKAIDEIQIYPEIMYVTTCCNTEMFPYKEEMLPILAEHVKNISIAPAEIPERIRSFATACIVMSDDEKSYCDIVMSDNKYYFNCYVLKFAITARKYLWECIFVERKSHSTIAAASKAAEEFLQSDVCRSIMDR